MSAIHHLVARQKNEETTPGEKAELERLCTFIFFIVLVAMWKFFRGLELASDKCTGPMLVLGAWSKTALTDNVASEIAAGVIAAGVIAATFDVTTDTGNAMKAGIT